MLNDTYLEWYPTVLCEKYIQLRNAYMITPSTLICYDENQESKICDIVNIFNKRGKLKETGSGIKQSEWE